MSNFLRCAGFGELDGRGFLGQHEVQGAGLLEFGGGGFEDDVDVFGYERVTQGGLGLRLVLVLQRLLVDGGLAAGVLAEGVVRPLHLLRAGGLEDFGDAVRIKPVAGPLRRINVKTMPYPGYPTDMNPQIAVLLCLAQGTSILTEGVWDTRFKYVEELTRMGASITVDGRKAVIEGGKPLKPATVKCSDLRAGAAMVIAALATEGETIIENIYHIERGYEHLVEKLSGAGADIKKIYVPDTNTASKAI